MGARCTGEVGARFGENGTDDVFYELFGGGGHEFGAGGGGAVGEGFGIADWDHPGVDGVCVGEFAGFAGEGLGVAFADFEIPVFLQRLLAKRSVATRLCGLRFPERRLIGRQLTCFVEAACAGRHTVWELDHFCVMVVIQLV